MNLTEGLPYGFAVKSFEIEIEAGTLFWLRTSELLENADEYEAAQALSGAIRSISRAGVEIPVYALEIDIVRRVLDRLIWFMLGGEDTKRPPTAMKGPKEKLLSYSADIAAIYAAFMQVYKIDLYTMDASGVDLIETLHWWKFLALLNNLPEGSRLTDYYMHFRGLDIGKLPNKTDADRKYRQSVSEIKQLVSLGQKQQAEAKAESWLDKRARELKAQKETPNVRS